MYSYKKKACNTLNLDEPYLLQKVAKYLRHVTVIVGCVKKGGAGVWGGGQPDNNVVEKIRNYKNCYFVFAVQTNMCQRYDTSNVHFLFAIAIFRFSALKASSNLATHPQKVLHSSR